MCVGVASLGGLETRVESDHQEHEAGSDTVDEVVGRRVRVFGAMGFPDPAAFS